MNLIMGNATGAETGARSRPARILLVENSSADVYLLKKTLQQRQIPYELTPYEDGDRAIAALEREDWVTPDLILLDINLPGSEGFDVFRAIRASPGWSACRSEF